MIMALLADPQVTARVVLPSSACVTGAEFVPTGAGSQSLVQAFFASLSIFDARKGKSFVKIRFFISQDLYPLRLY